MSTTAQDLANKRNAEKSTGPRTLAGKARSSRNATRHGLRAECPVLEGLESLAEWLTHRDVYVGDLKPEGPVETRLAEQIASLEWRIGRADAFQRDVSMWEIQSQVQVLLDHEDVPKPESHKDMDIPSRLQWLLDGPHADHPMVKEILSVVQRHALPEAKLLDLIIRYTGSLERALNRAERRLDRLQERRWAEEDRAADRADRNLRESRVEGRRAEAKKPLELAKIDPGDPAKGSAFEQEMDRLERQEPIAPPAAPERPRDLGSFGREALKGEPAATSVATAPVAKAAPMPPHPSQVVFRDSKGRIKPPEKQNRFERRAIKQAEERWNEAQLASQPPVAEVKIDPTSASGLIGTPPLTV